MKLIYIYGPPAVGKLKVAKQLVKITKFRLFHNHLTADCVSSIFPSKDKISNKLKCQIVYKMLEAAAKYKVKGVIFTKVYDSSDNNFVKNVIDIVEKYDGEVLFVRLYCKHKKLFERVIKNSRKTFDKVKTVKDLKIILKKNNKFETIHFKKSLTINNDSLSPKKCADKIKEYYNL